jgi:hypothetical protein
MVKNLVSQMAVGYLVDIRKSQGHLKEPALGVRPMVGRGPDLVSQVAARPLQALKIVVSERHRDNPPLIRMP